MKAIQFNGDITSITSKIDKSLGLRISTPELSVEERSQFIEYQGINSVITIEPLEEKAVGQVTVDKLRDGKSASERLRNVLFALWSIKKEHGEYLEQDFDTYYRLNMEGIINKVKEKMEEYE